MKIHYHVLILIAFFGLLSPVFADDALVAVAPGDIVFEKTPYIIMQDETLTISKLSHDFYGKDFKVDVNFHFKNISDQDITRKIVFALPPVVCNESNHSMWAGFGNGSPGEAYEKGLKDLVINVDGKAISFTPRIEVMLGKKNITTLLKQLKLPLNPCQIRLTKEGKLDPKYAAALTTYHLLTQDNSPAWSENIYYQWTQTFPAKKVLEISHHYTPVVGSTVPSPQTVAQLNQLFTERAPRVSIWNRHPADLQETNPELVYSSKSTAANDGPRFCVIPSWIIYRLTTGAYWNGGIGKFHLIIMDRAGAPFAVNKFYSAADDVQTQKSKNQMSFLFKNFIPKQDLLVQFLSLPQSAKDLQSCGIS
jgi:hypothetical protein